MTDHDSTQRYEPPAAPPAPVIPPPEAADPGAPGASEPVATTPVAAGGSGRRGGRLRWLLVGLLVLVVAGTAAAATMLLTSDSGDPDVLAWAPADSLVYTEVRLDLPGDQQQQVAALMSAFPGFDDQAAFPTKLDEVLDQLVAKGTDGKQSWAPIDAWWGRQLSVSVGPLPERVDTAKADGRALLLANVEDAAAARAWLAKLAADQGATTGTEAYNGVEITTVTHEGSRMADVPAGWAITGPVLAVGDLDSVKAAIDTKGTAGLNTVDQFQVAEASVSGDRLAFSYLDVKELVDGLETLADQAPGMEMFGLPVSLDDATVDWSVAAVRADDGAFVVETRSPHLESMGEPNASDTTLASVVPPTTVLLAEGHDVGEALTRFKTKLGEVPDMAGGLKELEDALRIVGGWDAVVGWMGEAGVAVTRDGDEIGGGIVIAPTNVDDPKRLLDQLRGFVALAGSGSGITVSEEPYNGTTITVVHLGDLDALTGAATDGAVDAPEDLTISYAVTAEAVVLGYGTDFTKAVLDAAAGESLADTARFAASLDQAGTTHSALFWLDVAGLRGLAEEMLPADEKAQYEADLKPYLDAFDSVIGTYAPAADLDRGTVIIRVTGD